LAGIPRQQLWVGGLPWGVILLAAGMLFISGCSRIPRERAPYPGEFDQVLARRQVFKSLRARGDLTLEHKTDALSIPLEITVSEDLVLEAKGEISHFLIPFEGEFRLVSDRSTTLLHTNIGTYDLAMDPDTQTSLRAFLLSLVGGGDWLLWWLAGNGCDLAAESECRGLKIRLEPDPHVASIGRWELSEPARGVTLKAAVNEYEPATTFPKTIRGVLEPQEIALNLKYAEVSLSARPDSMGAWQHH
jgi:hypothetical protein